MIWSLEIYKPHAMFGTSLDIDLNKPTEKIWMLQEGKFVHWLDISWYEELFYFF